MKKIFEFSADDEKYILKNTNPNEDKEEFVINKKEMQFDTNAFYKYVFSDIISAMDVEIIDKTLDNDKAAKRVYAIVIEISKAVMKKMNEKCLQHTQ
jgi:hypothetical protein